jgi:hypothetical protein
MSRLISSSSLGTETVVDVRPFNVEAMLKKANRDVEAGEMTLERAVLAAGVDAAAVVGELGVLVGADSCDVACVSVEQSFFTALLFRLMYHAPG